MNARAITDETTSSSLDRLLLAAEGKRLVIFDLDNTLADETQFLFAGYEAAAVVAAAGDSPRAAVVARWLKRSFLESGRAQLFERMSENFPDAAGGMPEWLSALRSARVPGGLQFLSWVAPFCDRLADLPLAILTNGNVGQQRNKYQQLVPAVLRDRFMLCCAANYIPKPHPAGLLFLLRLHHCLSHEALYIGDTNVDEACAAAAEVPFAWAPAVGAPPWARG